MAQVTLIVGGPGTGKTEEIISRLARGYQGGRVWDVLLLTPSIRHADQLRRRLVARCGVAMGLRVESLVRFSHRIAASRASSTIPRPVAEELLLRITRQEVETGDASYFRPILHTRGLGRLLRAAILNLVSEDVDPLRFRAAAGNTGMPALKALAAIYAAYLEELSRRGWTQPAAQPFEAAQAIDEGASLADLVVLDGFQMFRSSELTLLKAVAKRTTLLLSMDPNAGLRACHDYQRLRRQFPQVEVIDVGASEDAPALQVLGGESADHEAQLRDIARFIKRKLVGR